MITSHQVVLDKGTNVQMSIAIDNSVDEPVRGQQLVFFWQPGDSRLHSR